MTAATASRPSWATWSWSADVEIGAGTTIDRGTYGPTLIGEGTKIDNQVMIAHNCRIGRHNMLCAQVGIAGSPTTGDYVVMAGQVGACGITRHWRPGRARPGRRDERHPRRHPTWSASPPRPNASR